MRKLQVIIKLAEKKEIERERERRGDREKEEEIECRGKRSASL